MEMMKAAKTPNEEEESSSEIISASEIVYWIDDLLIQILQRLPLKPRTRLSLVSKRWNALLKNLDCRNRTATGLLFYSGTGTNRVGYLPFSKDVDESAGGITTYWPPRYEILQSCNGLLLCVIDHFTYYVCNPTTGMYCTILSLQPGEIRAGPIIHTNDRYYRLDVDLGVNLAFDPDRSPYYKALHVKFLYKTKKMQMSVYSSETRVWKPCSQKFKYFNNQLLDRHLGGRGVYCNGSIHWLRAGCYFNMDELRLKKLPPLDLPNDRPEEHLFHIMMRSSFSLHNSVGLDLSPGAISKFYFGESCGHLHYIADRYQLQFTVCEMKSDYSEWFAKYHVDLSTLTATYPQIIMDPSIWPRTYPLQVLSVIRGEEDKDTFLVLKVMGIFAKYNLVSDTIEKLFEIEDDVLGRYYGHQYFESPGLA